MLAVAAAEPNRPPRAADTMAEAHVCAPIDANGNLTSDGARTLQWDALDRLVGPDVESISTAYHLDGNGQMVRRVKTSGLTTIEDRQFLWCSAASCEERDLLVAQTVNLFDGGRRKGSGDEFVVTDHLGSLSAVTDGTSSLLSRYVYDPAGRPTAVVGSDSGAAFTGHAMEPQLGVYFTRTRLYDPELGR